MGRPAQPTQLTGDREWCPEACVIKGRPAHTRCMNGRERTLAALDGLAPDRIPLALSFYRVDGAALAPPGAWRDDLVDVGFVEFPVSPEEEELRRRALPHPGDTRLGSASQAARYGHWGYHPEAAAAPTRWRLLAPWRTSSVSRSRT